MRIQRGRAVSAAMLVFTFLSAGPLRAQDALDFFKNYFVTGDYQVGGVGLSGTGIDGIATGIIHVNDVPQDAEILAAFLYWQVVSKESLGPESGIAGATFNGIPLGTPEGPLAKVLDDAGTAPCWSSGGGTGSSGGVHRTYVYRADVLRFFDVDPVTGRHVVSPYVIQLPDSGTGNGVPNALGASLVVIYRDPSGPLSAIVLYDGGYTLDNSTQLMSQTVEGFYDPAGVGGKMTHIVGSGQANKSERLVVLGQEFLNPFTGAEGPAWDNFTFTTSPAPGPAFTTSVDTVGINSFDCLTWGAIVYRTAVQDSDADGLLDSWETEALVDPNGQPLPDLAGMGASPFQPDVFVEVGYLFTSEETTYGGISKPAHTHLPTAEALRMVGDAFASKGVQMHFDVGNHYQNGEADPYIIEWRPNAAKSLARGGESMHELATVCARDEGADPPDPPWICQFSDHPGTVGWKSGFRFFRDALLDDTVPEGTCEAPGNDGPGETCERVFDRNRKDMFRYALFAHALGVPQESCLVDDPSSPDFGYPDLTCMDTDPAYHAPVTNTGVADFPGGDLLVTLGGFEDLQGRPVGTDFWQASTLMHELGHTFELRHGGDELANCKPNYLSVMNYLFQLRGLVDENGELVVDYSGQALDPLDENFLSEPDGLGFELRYRTAWYAPLVPGTFGALLGIPPARRHCDGSPLLPTDGEMVRIDGTGPTGVFDPIDWNANGAASDSGLQQDINFDGVLSPTGAGDEPLNGSDDWQNLRLNQVGGRRNVGGWFFVPDPDQPGEFLAFMGPLSLDVGRGDLGRGDLGRGDLGRGDLGRGDLGRGDLGRGDLGRGDLGRGDLGRGDLGRGDLGRGDLGRGDLGRGDLGVGASDGVFELDPALVADLGNSPPNALRASVIEDFCDGSSPADCHRIRLDWRAPNVGSVSRYHAFRIEGGSLTPQSVPLEIGVVPAVSGQGDYLLIDFEELPNGEFTYYVVADFDDGSRSGPSNFATVTAINDAPLAADDNYGTDEGTPLVVAPPGVLGNDADVDSPTLTVALVSGPSNGVLALEPDGSFTYTPHPLFAGEDRFTYVANDVDPSRSSNVATVTITVVRILYDFEGVNNLPPRKGQKFNPGSTIPLEWRFLKNGVVIDSSDASPRITVRGPSGDIGTFTPENPGSSSFQPPTADNGWTWQFNWQTVRSDGSALPSGSYELAISSLRMAEPFVATFVLK